MPNGEFPTEEWLRKRGKFANREGESYNTLSVYIKLWLGGIRNLRNLIGQAEVSTQQWDKKSALAAYKAFYDKHGLTPQQVRHNHRRKSELRISKEAVLESARISSAIEKYAGGADLANETLGIQVERQVKWSKKTLLAAFKQIVDEYRLSPNQVIYDHKKSRIELPAGRLKLIGQIKDAVTRFPGGLDGVYAELDIQTPKRQRN